MRRHVENAKEGLGIIALALVWMLALMALAGAANGQQLPSSTAQATEQKKADAVPTQAGAAAAEPKKTSIAVKNAGKTQTAAAAAPAGSSEPEEQVTLTRFVLISIPDRQLALVDNGQVVKTYPIAVGAHGTPSPQGEFTIVNHAANPTWTHKGKVVGPGKGNPVGTRWIGLSLKGYGIHGTNAPKSIGKAASHGCIRMGKKDIEELFTLVRVGDTVSIRGERDDLIAQVFGSANSEVQVASAALIATEAGQE